MLVRSIGLGEVSTYNIVLDAVQLRVGLIVTLEVMLNLVNSQNTKLLESPTSQVGDELLVGREDSLSTLSSNLGVKGLVLQHLSSTNDSDARRVASLEDRDKRKLLSSRKQLIRLNCIALLLGVVAISGRGRPKNGCKKRS